MDSQEKLNFFPVSEPQELVGAFPPTIGHSLSSHARDEDQSLSNINVLPTSQPSTATAAKSPSKSVASNVQGQDVQINSMKINDLQLRENQGEGAVAVSTTTLRSANFQSPKGECYQHEEHHTIQTSTLHSQSQFFLTNSAPSPSPSPAPSQSGLQHVCFQENTVNRLTCRAH